MLHDDPIVFLVLIGVQAPTSVLTEYILVLARIAVTDKQMFMTLMSAAPQVTQLSESQVWEAVLNQWWTRVCLNQALRHVLLIHSLVPVV